MALLIAAILFACAAAAGPLTTCATQFAYSCIAPTVGGYTVTTPLPATGSTEVTGYLTGGAVVFDQTVPIPPSNSPASDVQQLIIQADDQVVLQSGMGASLPACTSSAPPCLFALGGQGGQIIVTSSLTESFVAADTPSTQQVNQSSTTLIAKLNGLQIFSETFSAPFSDPGVQGAVTTADALLAGDGAVFGAPFLVFSLTSLNGSQVSYIETSESQDGTSSVTTTTTFGPAYVVGTPAMVGGPGAIALVVAGQEDVNINTNTEYAVDRNVITTNTFLTTQTYEIDSFTSAVPEPGTLGLIGGALGVLALRRRGLRLGAVLAAAIGLARGGSLPACTGSDLITQETTQSNCVLTTPVQVYVVTSSFTNDPIYLNTPVVQTVNDYQTTLTAILNGGTSVYQQTFFVPFSDPSVLAAITAVDGIFTSDGATFGSPFLTSNSTTLESSPISYVATSPTFTTPALFSCVGVVAATSSFNCSGVTVTATPTSTSTIGPGTIMTGLDQSDEFDILAGQSDVNINMDYTYTVDQNAITTNTYLTTQSYEIDGTTNSTVPEPSTFAMLSAALAAGAIVLRRGRG